MKTLQVFLSWPVKNVSPRPAYVPYIIPIGENEGIREMFMRIEIIVRDAMRDAGNTKPNEIRIML